MDSRIARLNENGTLDLSFATEVFPAWNSTIYCAVVQPDGKSLYHGDRNSFIARLHPNGLTDASFLSASFNQGIGYYSTMILQSDGKLLVGGTFTTVGPANINRLVRLNADSTYTDTSLLNSRLYFGTFIQGAISNVYRVEWTADLNTTSLWTPLTNVMLEASPQFFLDPNPLVEGRFYRAVRILP